MKNFGRILMAITTLGLGTMVGNPSTAEANDRDRHSTGICRDYSRSVYDGNFTQISYGTACQHRDGNWYVVNETFNRPHYNNGRNNNIYVISNRGGGAGLYDRGYVIRDRDWDNRHDHWDNNRRQVQYNNNDRYDRRYDRDHNYNYGYNSHSRH